MKIKLSWPERLKNFREKRKADKEYSIKENKRIENLRKLKVAKMNSTEKASYNEKKTNAKTNK